MKNKSDILILLVLGDIMNEKTKYKKAAFAAGCFWGVEESFRNVNGVISTSVGYMGGHTNNPTYEDVCSGETGHAETVQVIYDPSIVSYDELLNVFWNIHDPTTLNRQGPDIGEQYRSIIFYYDEDQKNSAVASKEKLDKSDVYGRKIVTELVPASDFNFFKAEEYHQQYLKKSGRKSCRF